MKGIVLASDERSFEMLSLFSTFYGFIVYPFSLTPAIAQAVF